MYFNYCNYCIDDSLILERKVLFPLLLLFFRARENISKMLTGITITMQLFKVYLMGHSGKEVSCIFSLQPSYQLKCFTLYLNLCIL